ncbi:MAG: accessory gene regulator ArgB-like protein [Eubacteriales bacterium]
MNSKRRGGLLMEKATNSVDHFLSHDFGYNQKEIDQIKYVLNVFLSEASKVFLLFVFFSFFKMQLLFLFSIFLIFPIRITSGGLHFKTYRSCFLFSTIYIVLMLACSQRILLHNLWLWPILFITIGLTFTLAPISSPRRPRLSEERQKKMKTSAILAILFEFAILHLLNDYSLMNLYIWVNIFHSFQLLISKGATSCQLKKNCLKKLSALFVPH